jgi:hypothetical protein
MFYGELVTISNSNYRSGAAAQQKPLSGQESSTDTVAISDAAKTASDLEKYAMPS